MTSPGEVARDDAIVARKAMSKLTKIQLNTYVDIIKQIASDEDFAKLDQTLSRYDAKGKLSAIHDYFEEDIKRYLKD